MGSSQVKSNRTVAARKQRHRCYYCGLPMWSDDVGAFAQAYRLTKRQARELQCSAEHLQARRHGGTAAARNIVAACVYCNQKRHRRRKDLKSIDYLTYVRRRIERGKWHNAYLPLQAVLPGRRTAAPPRPVSG